jgi:uncharacterized membrane protein
VSEQWDVNKAVINAFRTREEGENYIDRILVYCEDAGSRVRRLLILLILCMVLFELLNRTAVDKISLSFVDLKDTTSIAMFLPVVVTHLEYKLVRQMLHWRSLKITFSAVIAVVQPGVAANKLASYLVPTIPLFSNRQPKGAAFERISRFRSVSRNYLLHCAPSCCRPFQFYAFSQLNRHMNGRTTITFIVAACMTIVLTLAYSIAIAMLISRIIHWWLYETLVKDDSTRPCDKS